MKIAVTGGKGGTGKSTVATALAVELSKYGEVLLVDADVDCPNDHLLLDIERVKVKDVETMVPAFDDEICTKCGRCSEVCKENAIVQVRDEYPMLIEEQCTGCQACKFACPVGAISASKQTIGVIYGTDDDIDLISGEMKPGVEESSLVVNGIKDYIENLKTEHDYIIIDTAAGTHCPVIAALMDVDLGIAVTEPTPLGEHDLELILELMEKLDIDSKIVINRSDIADKSGIENISESFEVPVVAEIPYSKEIEKNYSEGEPIKHESIEKIVRDIK
ncbi:MAG: P-loop NTPase [Candidatus Aenigmatarchaeota archaeon]